jgi:tRNA G18 (ribose-2'-O)-methylase SpoU
LDVPRIVAIDDPNDPRIAAYRDIREADLVGREGHFIAEGEVVVRVLLTASRHEAISLLLAEKRAAALQAEIERLPESVPVYAAPQELLDEIAGFPMHRGILALGRRRAFPSAEERLAGLGGRAIVLVLFAIANHDNMGGIFRNAAAFGADLVILDSDCCAPLYRKAIRVSAGNVLRVPYARLDRGTDALGLLAAHGFEAFALSPDGASTLSETKRPDRAALLLGAEGPGLPESILARAKTVRIPMTAGVDSLNVATASGIVLHHFAEDRLVR